MLAERVIEWTQQWKEEGRREGRREGLAAERTLLKEWVATAKHPVTKWPYTAMVYQPMLEVLA